MSPDALRANAVSVEPLTVNVSVTLDATRSEPGGLAGRGRRAHEVIAKE
jgi:hypothetical protein